MINSRFISRGIIFPCLYLLNIIHVIAQDASISLETVTIINSGVESLGKESESFIGPNNIFWYTSSEWDTRTRELRIFKTNYQSKRTDTLVITINDSITISSLPMIAATENYLILTDDYYFHQYKFEMKNNQLQFSNRIAYPYNFAVNKVIPVNDSLFLFHCLYNFHPDDKKYNTNLAIFNAKKNTFGKYIHPNLPCIAFSHLEKEWIAVNSNTIALASPCGYKIFLYDLNLNLRDSMCFNPENWRDLPNLELPFNTSPAVIHPKLLIDKLIPVQDTISRIEKIQFADDSTLLVSSINGQPDFRRNLDIWNIKNRKLPLYSSMQKIKYSDLDTIHTNELLLNLSSGQNLKLFDGKAIIFSDENYNYKNNCSFRTFNQLKDIYYESNDPQFSIGIYKINMPGDFNIR